MCVCTRIYIYNIPDSVLVEDIHRTAGRCVYTDNKSEFKLVSPVVVVVVVVYMYTIIRRDDDCDDGGGGGYIPRGRLSGLSMGSEPNTPQSKGLLLLPSGV